MDATTKVRAKEFHFPVTTTWDGQRRTTTHVEGKQPLAIATPPEFRGTDPTMWSPEDAFVTAAASCLAVTIAGLAEREELTLRELSVDADGVVGRRADGRFGFTRIDQTVRVATDADDERARALVAKAEETCLVSVSLDVPVETVIEINGRTAS